MRLGWLAWLALVGCDLPTTMAVAPDAAADAAAGQTAVVADAGVTVDLPPAARADADGAAGSRCRIAADAASCDELHLTLDVAGTPRVVHYQLPLGAPPASGWAVALMFQGSFFSAAHTFAATTADPFGAYYQTLTLAALLDGGFAVLAPEATDGGTTFWDTNVPPWNVAWSGSPDDLLMNQLFAAVARGDFGPLDDARWYATGLSSGGYMTSRMAVSYPGRFRALAIQSASYATCGPTACVVPSPLPSDHPPTLFLHGQNDTVVPLATMLAYHDELARDGLTTDAIIDPTAGHQWIAAAPAAVLAWFQAR
jgi:poly(3-hydroxybutyrate) depolymerase